MPSERDRSYANAVVRACDVLKAFRHESETLGLVELVSRTGLSKTTYSALCRACAGRISGTHWERSLYFARSAAGQSHFPARLRRQTDSEILPEVTVGLERAAARQNVHLIKVNNRYSAREALRNADLLIRENVALVSNIKLMKSSSDHILAIRLG